MADKKDIAKRETTQLPSIPDPKELEEIFQESFNGVQPSFEVIKVPTGGGLAWTVPGEGDEPEMKKDLVGVILDHYPSRAYWPDEYGGGNMPPECSSLNGKTGSKYGDCMPCQYRKWGSGRNERGKACKKIYRIFALLAGHKSIFPYLIPLPPTSSPPDSDERPTGYEGSLHTYNTKIAGRLKKLSAVWTKFKLVQDKNPEGIAYSKVQCFFVGDLREDEKKLVGFLKENLKSSMRQKPFEVTEYQETRGEEQREADREERDPWDK